MNIAITFRHLDASDAVRDYATEKLGKLQKFLRQPMRAKATLSLENKKQCCEVEVSAGGTHFVAHDAGDDMYVAASVAQGEGATLLVYKVDTGDTENGDDETGPNDYQTGATVELGFSF